MFVLRNLLSMFKQITLSMVAVETAPVFSDQRKESRAHHPQLPNYPHQRPQLSFPTPTPLQIIAPLPHSFGC